MQRLITLVLIFALPNCVTLAQISHGGLPYSVEQQWDIDMTSKLMPQVDAVAMDMIDQQHYMEKGRSIRFGEEHEVAFNLSNSGEWRTLQNNDRVWRLKIKCPDAYHTNLIYDSFFMPEGGRFYVYNADASHVLGAFTAGNNKSYGTFSTGLVRGDETILEYYEPAAVKGQGRISVATVVHGYRNMLGDNLEKGYGDSGSCNINVNCPEGADWQVLKTSVARIVAGGFDHCTGSMINTVRQDCTPYFLTAEHCAGGEQNWLFYFNWESPGCQSENIALDQSVSGGVRKAGLFAGDFEIVELSADVPLDYNVYFAGWNAENTPASRSVGIHHPAGDIKKISFNEDPLESSTFYGTPNTHWEVTEWEEGTTEGGSSGSAIFDTDQRIVGMLSGGQASCSFTSGFDVYGKMSYNWEQGNSADERLKDWLDPDDTGILVLDGRSCSVSYEMNAALIIQEPAGVNCAPVIVPKVRLSNQGINALNVLSVEYTVDGGAPNTSVWSGNLASGATIDFELDAFVNTSGDHTFSACIKNINGSLSDDNIVDNCASVSFSCDDVSASIDDEVLSFEAYPNPALNHLNLELGSLALDELSIALTDVTGREVLTVPANTEKVHIALPASLVNGTYLLTVKNAEYSTTRKINIIR